MKLINILSNKILEKEQIINKLELIFKGIYLLEVLLAFNNLVAGSPIISILNYFLVAFGFVLLLLRAFRIKNFIRTPRLLFLILFVASMCVSSLFNIKYGIIENVQSIIWTTLQFGLLFAFDSERDINAVKKDFKILSYIFCGYVAIANIISLGMFIKGYGAFGQYSYNGNIMGYIWGRLWGVYSDPNNSSVFCVVSIILSLCAILSLKKKPVWKILLIVNIILDLIYIQLSDSRTGIVVLFVGIFVTVFLVLKNIKFANLKIAEVVKSFVCIVISCFIAISCIAVMNFAEKSYNVVIEYINNNNDNNDTEHPGSDDSDNDIQHSEKPSLPLITGRDESDTENDISNRRFALWESGFDIWKTSPVFGVSQRNIVAYAKENLPKTYLVNNDLGCFNSTHNMFFDVLVSQGVVGIAILVGFFISVAVLIVRTFIMNKKNRTILYQPFNAAIIGVLVALSCSCMFILDIVYLNSAATFLFWTALGYILNLSMHSGKLDS